VLDVYPLALPEGEGLTIPVKLVGDLGFRNYRRLLVLIVPTAVSEVVHQELAEEVASTEAAGTRFVETVSGGGLVAELAVRSSAACQDRGCVRRCRWGSGGEIGVEAG
jgi:hypothetical protein